MFDSARSRLEGIARFGWPLAVLVTFAVALHAVIVKDLGDFRVYLTAAERALGGEGLYFADDRAPYKYAPGVALLFSPLAMFPPGVADWLWTALSVGALLFFMRWAASNASAVLATPVAPGSHLVVALLCVPFSKHLFALGQIDAVLLATAAASEVLGRRRPWLSGALWGAAVLVKPTFLILLPLALLRRERVRIAGLFAGIGLGLMSSAVVYGFAGNLARLGEWRGLLSGASSMLCEFDNQAFAGMVCRSGVDPLAERETFWGIVAVGSAVLALALFGLAARRWRTPDYDRLATAAAFYLTALLSPHGWRPTLLGLIPLLYLLVGGLSGVPRLVRATLLLAPAANAAIGVLGYELLGRAAFRGFVIGRGFGLLAFATAVVSLLWVTRTQRVNASSPASPARRHPVEGLR